MIVVQRDLNGVEMPNPGAARVLSHVRDCLDIVEAAAKKVPAGAVDDALARELGTAFRASSAAVLGAAWSSQLAEPLHSVSPALAAFAHQAAMQRLNRRGGLRGLPDKVRPPAWVYTPGLTSGMRLRGVARAESSSFSGFCDPCPVMRNSPVPDAARGVSVVHLLLKSSRPRSSCHGRCTAGTAPVGKQCMHGPGGV